MNYFQKKKDEIKQFAIYTLVGCSNTVIDVVIMNLLWSISGTYIGNINYLFKLISFSVYSTTGYMLNKKFTFKSSEKNNSSYIGYVSTAGTITAIDTVLIALITQYNIFNLSDLIWANTVNLSVCAVMGFIGFLINKFIIFGNKNTK